MKVNRSLKGILLCIYVPGHRQRMTEQLLDTVRDAKKGDDKAIAEKMFNLLRLGADINGRRPGMEPVLHTLCAAGFGSAVEFALDNGAAIYGGTESALSTAATHVNISALRLLIPRSASTSGSTTGYSNAIHALLKNLPKTNDPSPRPDMKHDALLCLEALMGAGGELSIHGQRDIVHNYQYLVPAQPQLQPAIDLMNAHLNEGIISLRHVLSQGVHPDLIAGYGAAAPLAWAMTHNDMDRVKLLLDYGANPDLYGAGLPSPVHQALRRGNMQAMEMMLAKGATGIAQDVSGKPVPGERDLYQLAIDFPGPVADYAVSVLDEQDKKKMAALLKTMATQRPISVQKKPVRFKPSGPLQAL